MGIEGTTVTDGILLPWHAEETRGTIWILAHGRAEAFDGEDCNMMQALANELAHQINNPLQGLMQTVFLFARGGTESGALAQQAMEDIVRLSDLVKQLLSFPR
jgi:nitrogen-specific signal transduction histidine kinase